MTGALAVFALLALSPIASAGATSPSGEHTLGQATIEPAYNDVTGQVIYLLTPNHAPLNVKSNPRSWAPFYLVVYPSYSTVGTLDCMGVPGHCPDHDGEIAGAATFLMPGVYSSNVSGVLGHDHLVAPPASGGDFNIAWNVTLVLFTNASFVNDHITTLSDLSQALQNHEVAEFPTGIVFMCAVVSSSAYNAGTAVSA